MWFYKDTHETLSYYVQACVYYSRAVSSSDVPIRFTTNFLWVGTIYWHFSPQGTIIHCCKVVVGADPGLQHPYQDTDQWSLVMSHTLGWSYSPLYYTGVPVAVCALVYNSVEPTQVYSDHTTHLTGGQARVLVTNYSSHFSLISDMKK